MPVVVLFHSVLGLRPAVRDWAARLTEAGYETHTPDLYDGEIFDSIDDGAAHVDAIGGIPELVRRTHAAVADLPRHAVYAGFSNGGVSAELLAASTPGARGAVLMHAALPPRVLGITEWPSNLPVQAHYSREDPFRSTPAVNALSEAVRASGSNFELFEYEGSAHLFADSDFADYDAKASQLMFDRMLAFLQRVSRHERR